MSRIVPFSEVQNADLIIDAVYERSSDGLVGGEPISKLLPGTGNMGVFRVSGKGDKKNWVILFSTGEDRHPIIFICGRDIAEILIKAGFNSPEQVESLLNHEFPI